MLLRFAKWIDNYPKLILVGALASVCSCLWTAAWYDLLISEWGVPLTARIVVLSVPIPVKALFVVFLAHILAFVMFFPLLVLGGIAGRMLVLSFRETFGDDDYSVQCVLCCIVLVLASLSTLTHQFVLD